MCNIWVVSLPDLVETQEREEETKERVRTDKRGWRRGGGSAQLFHYFHYWQRPRREVKRVRSGEVGGEGGNNREGGRLGACNAICTLCWPNRS